MLYKNFSSLVIAGGATKVISGIGILKFLEEQGMVNSIKNLVGTSAGAVLCAFITLGYNSDEIKDFFIKNFCKDESITKMNLDEIFSIFTSYGLNNGDNLKMFFERMISTKLGPHRRNITFIDLAKLSGKNLVICVANLTKERQEFWSVDTTPNMQIITALRASCAIPIVFTPVRIDDNIFVDGGLYDNFPMDYFSNKTLRDILGVNIISKGYQKNSNFMEYIKYIISSVMNKLCNKILEDNKDDNMITLEFEDDNWFSLMDMSIRIPEEMITNYIDIGYQKIKERLSNLYIDFQESQPL